MGLPKQAINKIDQRLGILERARMLVIAESYPSTPRTSIFEPDVNDEAHFGGSLATHRTPRRTEIRLET
ncbi:hypothetical protein [Bradyrhizobium sp. USDA 4502]